MWLLCANINRSDRNFLTELNFPAKHFHTIKTKNLMTSRCAAFLRNEVRLLRTIDEVLVNVDEGLVDVHLVLLRTPGERFYDAMMHGKRAKRHHKPNPVFLALQRPECSAGQFKFTSTTTSLPLFRDQVMHR